MGRIDEIETRHPTDDAGTEDQGRPVEPATLRGWKYGFNSPFKAEAYFISTRKFTDLKWGTPGPAMMRDKDFGMVRVTAFGIYAVRAKDAGSEQKHFLDGTF